MALQYSPLASRQSTPACATVHLRDKAIINKSINTAADADLVVRPTMAVKLNSWNGPCSPMR